MRSTSSLSILSLACGIGSAHRSGYAHNSGNNTDWEATNFKTLVTFGDSYTDENRLGYFTSHNGSAPPTGWEQGVGLKTSTGGLIWPRYASIYSNLSLYNYAVSGAVCSNEVSPRTLASINAPFPDVQGYEIPAFIADSKYISPSTGTPFFTGTARDTAYAIWIGTNDLGNNAFLTDSQLPGKTLKDYTDCVYSAVDKLYQNGGRYFVLLNVAPLQLLPQYATPENGGLAATKFFPDKPANITEVSWRIYEEVATVNEIYAYRTPFEAVISDAYPEAKFANFDVNALITDIWSHPENYLNGTAPLNVTGVINQCDTQGANCVVAESKDSFAWYDELHPSEQTDRIIAREFVGVLGGKSKWATYWS